MYYWNTLISEIDILCHVYKYQHKTCIIWAQNWLSNNPTTVHAKYKNHHYSLMRKWVCTPIGTLCLKPSESSKTKKIIILTFFKKIHISCHR